MVWVLVVFSAERRKMIQPMRGPSRMPQRMMEVLACLRGARMSKGMSNAAQVRAVRMRRVSVFMM